MKKSSLLLFFLIICLPAHAQDVDYGPHGLFFRQPTGFVDSQAISNLLFEQTVEQSGLDGVLLKIYLPEDKALLYADNLLDSITRQVCLYGIKNSQNNVLGSRAVDLMFTSLYGAYANFSTVSDSVRRDRANLELAMRNAARNGENLLVDTLGNDLYQGYLTLISYRMKDDFFLSTVVCTAIVHVADTVVMINTSSIITEGNISSHTTWARNTAEVFVEMLVSANQNL